MKYMNFRGTSHPDRTKFHQEYSPPMLTKLSEDIQPPQKRKRDGKGMMLLPTRRTGEMSKGVAPEIRYVFCGQFRRNFPDSCLDMVSDDSR